VEQAQLNLGFTKITSPIDGIASIAKGRSATWWAWHGRVDHRIHH
jgi:hypothetical protein